MGADQSRETTTETTEQKHWDQERFGQAQIAEQDQESDPTTKAEAQEKQGSDPAVKSEAQDQGSEPAAKAEAKEKREQETFGQWVGKVAVSTATFAQEIAKGESIHKAGCEATKVAKIMTGERDTFTGKHEWRDEDQLFKEKAK